MKVEVRVDVTANEWRRLFGGADVTPLVGLMSDFLDDVAMVAVEQRLAALEADGPFVTDGLPAADDAVTSHSEPRAKAPQKSAAP